MAHSNNGYIVQVGYGSGWRTLSGTVHVERASAVAEITAHIVEAARYHAPAGRHTRWKDGSVTYWEPRLTILRVKRLSKSQTMPQRQITDTYIVAQPTLRKAAR